MVEVMMNLRAGDELYLFKQKTQTNLNKVL